MKINIKELTYQQFPPLLREFLNEELGYVYNPTDKEENYFLKLSHKVLEKIPNISLNMNELKTIEDEHPNIEFPKKATIEVLFLPEHYGQQLANSFNIKNGETNQILGFAAFSNGDGLLAEGYLNTKNQVFAFYPDNAKFTNNLNYLKDFFDNEEEAIKKIINTLTHEISHQILFLETSLGLSPSDVDILFDSGEFNYSLEDCISGTQNSKYYLYFKDNECGSTEEDYEIMEEIVEQMGMNLLSQSQLNFMQEYKALLPLKSTKNSTLNNLKH